MLIYHYDPHTGSALGSSEADRDPLGGGWLLPAYSTASEPPAAEVGHAVRWQGGAWQQVAVPPAAEEPAQSLDDLRAARDAALSAECAAAIVSGVTADALGEPIFYPTGSTDQVNLAGAVVLTLLPGLPADWSQELTCRDAGGIWARRPHSAAQAQAVGRAVAAHVDSCRARLAARRADLAAAEDAGAVQAVAW